MKFRVGEVVKFYLGREFGFDTASVEAIIVNKVDDETYAVELPNGALVAAVSVDFLGR